jgi:uncharacterized protein YbaP (TraB family)
VDALRRQVARTLPAVAACAILASPAAAAPALWRVSDADSSIWLFGSVHILDPSREWRTPAFNEALANADEVFFELVLDEAGMATLGQLTIERGLLPPGQRLGDFLTDEENAQLDAALADVGLSRAMVDAMQPWMAGLTISTAAFAMSDVGGSASFAGGIESQLQAELPDHRERGLETPQEQIAFMSAGTTEEQTAGLMQAIDQLDEANATFGGLIEAWFAGDVEAIHDEIVASIGSIESEEYQTLVARRNERWSKTAVKLLSANNDALIVVGAAHLAGPSGLPTLMEGLGFAVERVDGGP